jgi:hypothetical protein
MYKTVDRLANSDSSRAYQQLAEVNTASGMVNEDNTSLC